MSVEMKLVEIMEKLSRLEQRLEDLDKKVDQLVLLVVKRNGYTLKILKIVVLGLLVAFGVRELVRALIGG